MSNPVYLIAYEFAYDYLTKNHVDLFSEQSDFDGVHGIMAYNRTLQHPGRAHQIKPMEEWIVSVGKHQGAIEGKAWVKVQTILERNKSKSYRRPRSNVALRSGLLICGSCGEYIWDGTDAHVVLFGSEYERDGGMPHPSAAVSA